MSCARPSYEIEFLAEDALLLRFGAAIDPAMNARVHAAAARLRGALPGVECIPAYASLLLRFEPRPGAGEHLRAMLEDVLAELDAAAADARSVSIPVWYGGEAGPDLAEVAAVAGLSAEEVVARHSAADYRVAMLGFAPGFPYLLGLDPMLAAPRRADPRRSVPAGSVAIGGSQTGIYPQALPGGWQLIGRTPAVLFDVRRTPPALLLPGDRVRLRAIGEAEYRRLLAGASP